MFVRNTRQHYGESVAIAQATWQLSSAAATPRSTPHDKLWIAVERFVLTVRQPPDFLPSAYRPLPGRAETHLGLGRAGGFARAIGRDGGRFWPPEAPEPFAGAPKLSR